ncbi:MAG TPA: acyl-CoA dehydrogenase family protein [Steroidobacteraceae bacterium]|nr:acyl-CoA dehydrogenase family protein [Steroidobacteraceae bacterium]
MTYDSAPHPKAAELIATARDIAAQMRAEQDESDARGRYSEAVHQRLLQGGFYRILQPRLFGGGGTDCETYIRVIMELSKGHPGGAWCYTLASSHALVLGSHFEEAVQRELFGPEGDFRAPYVAAATGMPKMERREGGYLVTGFWTFASGVPVCNHFFGGALIPGPKGVKSVMIAVPRADIEILADWGGDAAMGMQASGSNSVRIRDVFVPDAHIVTSPVMRMSTETLPEGTPGTRLHGSGVFLGILFGWFSCEFGAILTGAARAALEEYEQLLKHKTLLFDPGRTRMHDPELQRVFGEAMCRADAAEALTLSATRLHLEQCDQWMRKGVPITESDTLRVWGIAREGCRNACECVEMLFRTAGAATAKRGDRLQRYFRDVQMYRIHIQSQAMAPMLRAQAHLGMELPPPMRPEAVRP